MLTLGAEYKDNRWGPTPAGSPPPKELPEQEELATVEETDTGKVHAWREFHLTRGENDDAFLSLDGLSRVGERDGVLQMVKKHEHLNSTTWPRR